MIRFLARTAGIALACAGTVGAQTLDSASLAAFKWRTVGPANFMGRTSDIVGIPSPSTTLFVAAAGGGIWKSTNNGITWRPVFDDKRIASMGMLAIAPSDTQQVWAGTGEPNVRNTVEPGAGVYKSTDGGITWRLMGLEKSQHIGRVVVHPTNPNVVYVAANGPVWARGGERGLYKTTDGGTSWNLVKPPLNDRSGAIDVVLDPRNPDVVWVAMWERYRTPYSLRSGGPGSGLFKSTDGGATWTEVRGGGFPEGAKGRIGIDIARSNADYMYAMVEAADPAPNGAFSPSQRGGGSGLYQSKDGGRTWTRTNTANVRPFYYSQVKADPKNPNRVYFTSTPFLVSDEGGANSRTAGVNVHVDDHGIWIDPNDPNRFVIANDGGVAITFDRGGNYYIPNNLPIAQFYEISHDYAMPYNICGGAQDNGGWCGPSRRRGNINNAYWFTVSGGDGFYTQQDPTNPDLVYSESQGGNMSRINIRTGERASIRPASWQIQYRAWEDSIATIQGDPLRATTRDQAAAIAALRSKQREDSIAQDYRFNWNTPFLISPHNPRIFYFAANRVFKSTQRGDNAFPISPDLSKNMRARIDTATKWTGGITLDNTGAEMYGTIVSLAESYLKPGLLIAGTDDGNVQISHNDGGSWENVSGRFPGAPTDAYVTRVEPSWADTNTFYVAMENHKWNDFKPYLYMTRDGGRSWTSIANNLPATSPADYLHVVREDPSNPNLLYVGSSLSVYVSLDKGRSWQKFAENLPSVPVFDLKIHPRDRELMAATHGRGFWVVDVAALQQMTPAVVSAGSHLFKPKTTWQYGEGPTLQASGNGNGESMFELGTPPYGAEIFYRIGAGAPGTPMRLTISDASGENIATLTGPGTPGVHKVIWNYGGTRPSMAASGLSPSQRRDSILLAVRGPQVLDSLTRAGFDSAAIRVARQTITSLQNPQAGFAAFGGRGGGGGGRGGFATQGCERPITQWDRYCERPGEGQPGQAGRGGGSGAPQPINPATQANVQRIFEMIGVRIASGRGGRGGGFAPAGPGGAFQAGPGDYMVTLSVGAQTHKQTFRVEAAEPGSTPGSPIPPR